MTDEIFAGFEPSNTTPVPDVLFDQLMTQLNDRELRAMLYIIRRTLGFKKTADVISYNQFLIGIKKQDGTQLDNGCGITSPNALSKALKSLEEKGLIISEKRRGTNKALLPTLYRVRFKAEEQAPPTTKSVVPPTTKMIVGYGQNDSSPTTKSVDTLLSKQYRQETVIQDTDTQETVRQKESNAVSVETDAPASLTEYKHRRETDPKLVAITQEMLTEKVIPPKITLPSKQTPIPQSQVSRSPDVAPSASVGASTAPAGAGQDVPAMALTAKQIKQQNERRTKDIWAIIERERQTKYSRTQRELYENSKGIECLLEDQIEDDTIVKALKAMDIYQRKQFTVLKFYGWIPNLIANESPPERGKVSAPPKPDVIVRPAGSVRSFNGIAKRAANQ